MLRLQHAQPEVDVEDVLRVRVSDCSGVHRSLGVHISAVKSANMDRWTTEELDTFKASGGNDAARAFFSQHGWNSNERGKR